MNTRQVPEINLAVLISGSGSNLQSIIDHCASRFIPARVALVISSREDAYALVRAEKAGIPTAVYRRKDFPDGQAADQYLLDILAQHAIDLIALAGFLKMVPPAMIQAYRGRIVNIHPGLLPKYGGKGMYGHFVHEAVLAAKEKETGVTIHVVDEIYDHGRILAQKRVPVMPGDTPDSLAARVLEVEHALYPHVLKELCETIIKERSQ
jgi:phosphoribosylglycinamide formyltransferase-1